MTGPSDRDEFLRLVDDHGAVVLGVLRRLCGNVPDAEDVFQETAVRVWRNFAARPDVKNPRAWLIAIAYRAFLDFAGRRRSSDELWDTPDTRTDGPGEFAIKEEEAQCLKLAVERLSCVLRQVVVLHYIGGLTIRETAEALGCPEGTVKSWLNAAITQLRSMLP